MSTIPVQSECAFSPAAVSAAALPLNVAVVGYGTVGSSVVRILSNERPAGLRLTHICNRAVRRKKSDSVPGRVIWTERFSDVLADEVDIVVELIGGEDDALHLVSDALRRGKAVVTANKKLIARYGAELLALAEQNGARLLYGASVAGGVPVLPGLTAGLSGDRIVALRGVLNGTCNFILSKLEQGKCDFTQALDEAKQLGYAEQDPTDDIESYDAQWKLAILSRVAFRADVDANAITRGGISSITPFDFACARELGCTIRQVARASLAGDTLRAAVSPALVPVTSPLARVSGNQNVVVATGIYGGDMVFCGAGAGGNATAVAVVSDMLSIAAGRNHSSLSHAALHQASARKLRTAPEAATRHVVRCTVRENQGAVAEIVAALARHGLEIQNVVQVASVNRTAHVAITVAPCTPHSLEAVAGELASSSTLVAPVAALPLIS